jgi:hypothetical protein
MDDFFSITALDFHPFLPSETLASRTNKLPEFQ